MLTNTKHTNAGSYTDSWSFSNDNYLNDSGSVTDKIGKAQPSVTINWSGSTYSGTANPASASVSGVGSPPANLGPADSLTYFSGASTGGSAVDGCSQGCRYLHGQGRLQRERQLQDGDEHEDDHDRQGVSADHVQPESAAGPGVRLASTSRSAPPRTRSTT